MYQYYFDEYGRQKPQASSLHPQLKTWTNLWRVDDPIGNRVDIVADDFVTNEVLGPGGHMNYWREARVRQVLMTLVGYPLAVPTVEPEGLPEKRQPTDPARGAGLIAGRLLDLDKAHGVGEAVRQHRVPIGSHVHVADDVTTARDRPRLE